jgi:hypothetical protein
MTGGSRIFDEGQRALVKEVLARIIPAQGKLPDAGDLGLVDFIEAAIGRQPHYRRRFIDGLADIEITASRQGRQAFSELPGPAKDATLRAVEASNADFFEELVRQTYNGYYTHPRILALIGYFPTSPRPQGEPPELLDETLLAKQRQRAPFWKEV